jgi:hypothetical protein
MGTSIGDFSDFSTAIGIGIAVTSVTSVLGCYLSEAGAAIRCLTACCIAIISVLGC